jgi:hypothetical protein
LILVLLSVGLFELLSAQEGIVPVNKFSGDPYVEKTMRLLADGEAPQFYRVQEGDTLFDICAQLIDEPDYWPKLWALNPDIKNPHFIYPGMLIRFYPGDTQRPPFLEVVAEEDVVPYSDTELEEVLVDYSSLFPQQGNGSEISLVQESELQFSASDMEEIGAVYKPSQREIIVPAFYYSQRPQVYAKAIQGTFGERSGGEGQMIWFGDNQGGTQIQNKVLSVLRATSESLAIGKRYEFVAHVKVMTTHETNVLTRVLRSRLSVHPGDILVDFRSVVRRYEENGSASRTNERARLIGMEYMTQNLAGTGSLVMLDKLVTPATLLPIYAQTYRYMDQNIAKSLNAASYPIGFIKVIGDVGQASLGVVLSSVSDIRVGDFAGSL